MKRKIDSYRTGELLNGVEFVKHTSKGTRRKAIFKCTQCKKDWEIRWDSINSGSKMCASCRSKSTNKVNGYKPKYKSLLNEAFRNIKKSAKDRNIKFILDYNFVINLITKNCNYCGCDPNQIKKNKLFKFKHNGIDRIDSSLPYTYSNVVPCCTTCNRAKSLMSLCKWTLYLDNLVKFRT